MNHQALAFRFPLGALLILVLCSIFLPACGQSGGPSSDPPPLKGAAFSGRFTLTDQDGRRVNDSQFDGRYRLTYFGFANCPDVCPVDLQVMGEGLRRFEAKDRERAARVQPIFITVDPARDTPEVLKRYVRNFHDRLIGLTGSQQEVDAVVKAHGASAIRGETTPGGGYNVDHTRYILLMGPNAEPIAIIPHETPDAVAAELDKWVR